VSTGDGSHEKMEDQVNTWSSISTRKQTLRSGTATATKKCDPGGESDYGAIRLLYDNRESMNDATHTVRKIRKYAQEYRS
jgi:hypothetical protein